MIKKAMRLVPLLLFAMLIAACKKDITPELMAAYHTAQDQYYQTHYAASETAARAILKNNGRFFQARLLLARNLFMQEKYAESEKLLKKICAKYDIYPEAEKWYIRALLQNKKDELAEKEIKRVLALDPDNLDFLSLAASYYAGKEDLKSRIEMLTQIPLQSDKIARAHLELARIYYSYLDYGKALAELDNCLKYLNDGHILKRPVLELRKTVIEKQENRE